MLGIHSRRRSPPPRASGPEFGHSAKEKNPPRSDDGQGEQSAGTGGATRSLRTAHRPQERWSHKTFKINTREAVAVRAISTDAPAGAEPQVHAWPATTAQSHLGINSQCRRAERRWRAEINSGGGGGSELACRTEEGAAESGGGQWVRRTAAVTLVRSPRSPRWRTAASP